MSTSALLSNRSDGSLMHSLWYHILSSTGGDFFGLGKGTNYFDLFNKDSPYAQGLIASFSNYAYPYNGSGFVNVLDGGTAWYDSLTDDQKSAVYSAYYNLWWFESDPAITPDMNHKLLGFLPWDAVVLPGADGKPVYVHTGSDKTNMRYFDPLSGPALAMKMHSLLYIGGAAALAYFGMREARSKGYF